MVAILTDDAPLTMPPLPLEYEGHEAIGAFLRWRVADTDLFVRSAFRGR